MKIICVYLCNYSDRNDYYISLMPYGITSIAAYLESRGHVVTLANFSSYGYKKAVELTIDQNADVAAVSIFSFNRYESLKYIRELKKRNPRITIIAGGQHPTFLSDEIADRYPEIDFIIKGEGELAISSLLNNTGSAKKIITGDRITDIDSLPFPSLFHGITIGVNANEQFKYIITSRGCPNSCTYCSSPAFWKRKVSMRSSESIINELIHLREKYGIIYFSIRDDNFTINKKRVLEFCRMLDESRLYMMWNCQARVDTIDEEMLIAMKQAGLEHIQYGVESGSERILRAYDKATTREMIIRAAKITRETGVYLSFFLMAGMHDETGSDINDTISLIKETLPHDSIVSPVAYYPGTAIYTDDRGKGLIEDSAWFDSADSGIYLHDTSKTSGAIEKILHENNRISVKAAYKPPDVKKHRIKTGDNCWMNDIIEGDIWQDSSSLEKASACYKRIIDAFPENIWGYLRLSESLEHISPLQSSAVLKKASELIPGNYEVWYRLAQVYRIIGDKKNALESASEAFRLNPMNTDVSHLYKKLKS
ncbi:MAG TPA: radical SAM protein [Spirochaetota bacterium]|nr:radical SAM protein [Spirochaetota bacterium]